ncbi:efflux transporter outer membrane subunit [Robbsia sp. Bb-Pol-6]|uniref:Efflux transporter outer membrane subunit n=1 Tax=Robbsia betulipollinis TaxID=2981849 RepID=A0ABT3ZS05_9BURK|nr:efflux transporter outer membrane subunit [Robbsia betulipollinis]MCY0389335.1 efflux transporter outer membrane subunit [Robbsia betulipollinis]
MTDALIRSHGKRSRITLLTGILTLMCSGCTVGPDFHSMAAPNTPRYGAQPLPERVGGSAAGEVQALALDRDIPAQWWQLFHSPELDTLVVAALEHNPTIDAAQGALRQAHAFTAAQRGAFFPTVSANLNPVREKTAGTLSSPLESGANYYSLQTAQLSVGFTPDIFGANRRQVESLEAQADAARFQLEAAKLTLASNVVLAAIQEASLRAQIDATRRLIDSQNTVLAAYRAQLALGQVKELDVLFQRSQLAQFATTLPPLEKQLAQQRDLLTVLAGRLPADEIAQTFTLASLTLPTELPVSLPSRLVRQRPDIRAMEAQLHSASAQIGIAAANRLPNLAISATWGSAPASFALNQLFRSGTGFWSIAGDLTQPIFDAGALKQRQRAAVAAYRQTAAQYRATVLTAFQNVADSLGAIVADADAADAAHKAEDVANRTLVITRQQRALGDVASLAVVVAEQAAIQARLSFISAQTARLSDSAALIQALGGGWWNAPRDDGGDGGDGQG